MTDDAPSSVQNLLELLDLSNAGGAQTDEDIFVGSSQRQYSQRVFGGQVLAQSLIAGIRTVEESRAVHSLHGYFLRAGDADLPITFGVQRLRDGRSFSARRIHAYQNAVPILSMIASFQEPDVGIDHQDSMPAGIPDPETLPSAAQLLAGLNHPLAKATFRRPFDVRHVGSNLYLTPDEGDRQPYQAVWMKAVDRFPDDPNLHRAALAFASDYTLLEPSLRPHGLSWTTPGMSVASLDHAMWWHRPARVDEWLLYVSASPSASGARGLNIGKFFTREGVLVASVAQEGMIRVPRL
ncbi:acyl-CoA thioesterase [Psychromicrobium sp. YIM B11713]|uniref:acyl-CoA thioesterase n=1 Tax=Psychromicrobium sp. YIM B11713 TaxID=3145233 RepID=UPI00374F9FF2